MDYVRIQTNGVLITCTTCGRNIITVVGMGDNMECDICKAKAQGATEERERIRAEVEKLRDEVINWLDKIINNSNVKPHFVNGKRCAIEEVLTLLHQNTITQP